MNIPAGHQPPSTAASGAPSALSTATRTASGVTGATAPTAVTHFAVHYAETATPGLPPVVFATEQVAVEVDGEWWWEYYLDAPSSAATLSRYASFGSASGT